MVVHKLVKIALLRKKVVNAITSKYGPVVLCDQHIGLIAECAHRLVEVLRPSKRVPYDRAAECQKIVKIVRSYLGHIQNLELREVHVELIRRLALGRHAENDLNAIKQAH